MSNMKSGFSTLNRWLGRKNKDKTVPNGKLSKSSTNLSVSTTNINETSQLEYNRITPLPAATSNAPFEQTFRITVLLPKDQLYVTRLGARVLLSKLLELVCENKQLDSEKYEFRNPVDSSQVYSCELTIGAVGLSEIRLCHKSESYDTFNTDEVIKLHRTSVRDSLSSSEFSSRNSKHTTKTASPYSSSNSLNSMDSTGMNCVRTPVTPPATLSAATPTKLTAPPRKKRAAPRPPSQIMIPEKSALVIPNGESEQIIESAKDATLPRKDYYVSTPNLSSPTLLSTDISSIDCNGNSKVSMELTTNGHTNEHSVDLQVEQKNARNLHSSVQNLSSITTESTDASKFPEPSPRKRLIQIKKKSAPVPPSRCSMYSEDSISISSINASIPSTPISPDINELSPATPISITSSNTINSVASADMPTPATRESTTNASKSLLSSTPIVATATTETVENVITATEIKSPNTPKPVPRLTTTTLLNASSVETVEHLDSTQTKNISSTHSNVSKVLLNRTPTPEPRSLSSEPPELTNDMVTQISALHNGATTCDEDDNISKQADSGIGEPIPSPIPDSLPSEGSAHECKSTFESSSDDDDMIKVYNFKLGKTLIKPSLEHKTLEDLTTIAAAQTDSGEDTPITGTEATTSTISETSSWNFSIPISPPPNFADKTENLNRSSEKIPDTPITPKIKQRPVLNFDAIATESLDAHRTQNNSSFAKVNKKTSELNVNLEKAIVHSNDVVHSPTAPITEIIDELSMIINEKRMDTVIKKTDNQHEIEAAKPNTLTNFSIATISQQPKSSAIVENGLDKSSPPAASESSADEEKLYRKQNSITNASNIIKQRKSVTRSDSFHTTIMQQQTQTKLNDTVDNSNGLQSRSSSHLSLTKLEQNGVNLNRRRSSSELSIGESPSLQSLEVIKTILNSRKNSLASSSDGETKTSSAEVIKNNDTKRIPFTESRKITSIDLTPKNENIVSVAQQTVNLEKTESDAKPKEVPKVYRYSGPPSINFSTWSERPKAQVSIKNEGDYIFGGKNANSQNAAVTTAAVNINTNSQTNSMPRHYRASTPAGTFNNEKLVDTTVNQAPIVAPKPVTLTMRMGIPEKEFRVPITVKPLKDVTVESVPLRTNAVENVQLRTKTMESVQSQTHAMEREANKSLTTITSELTTTQIGKSNDTQRRTFSQVSNTSTIPRSNANRFSTPAVGPALLRTTSITQLDANKPKVAQVDASAAPFGQNTLRKTGLKEKILAKEEKQANSSNNVAKPVQISSNTVSVKTHSSTLTNGTHSSVALAKTLQSAKLELKIQKSTNILLNQTNSPTTTTLKSAPIVPTAPTPPAPPMAPPKAAALKSFSTPATSDPRDQLLDAIRNFNREKLKTN